MSDKIYLRNSIPSFPCPRFYKILKKDLDSFFNKEFSSEFRYYNGELYVRYSDLFKDSVLEKVWFSHSLSLVLTNEQIDTIKSYLIDWPENKSINDYADIYILDASPLPLRSKEIYDSTGIVLFIY